MKAIPHKALAGLIVLIVVAGGIYYLTQGKSASAIGPEAKEIEATGLREFAADTDVPYTPISSHDKAMYQAVLDATKISGDGTDKTKNAQAVVALTKVINDYPQLSAAYLLRATLSLAAGSTDYQSMESDIDNAIKYTTPTDTTAPSKASLYAAKAKIDFEQGNYQATLDDLDTALKSDLTDPNGVFNTGGTKAEDTSNITVLTLPDFNTLVAKFPNDYRVYMDRGLFYGSFSFYDTKYYSPAFDDLKKAVSLASNPALANYFLGSLYSKLAFNVYAFPNLGGTSAYDSARDQANTKALSAFVQASFNDPTLKEAYASGAEALLELKRYPDAIADYDKVIQLDPNDAGAYNDRGLANEDINNYFAATSDFSDAIRLKLASSGAPTILGNGLIQTYQNRADAYTKSQSYDLAIDDYGKAIGMQFGSGVIVMTVPLIRSIYPELSNISDKDLIEGLRQKYDPDMSAADFASTIQTNKGTSAYSLSDIYVARADTEMKADKYKAAATDYQRSLHSNPSSSTNSLGNDRWKDISTDGATTYSIDALTLDFSKGTQVSLWFKATNTNSGSYTEQNYEIDCTNKQIKSLSATSYDALGNAGRTTGEQDWQSVIPQTIGETLYNGMCTS